MDLICLSPSFHLIIIKHLLKLKRPIVDLIYYLSYSKHLSNLTSTSYRSIEGVRGHFRHRDGRASQIPSLIAVPDLLTAAAPELAPAEHGSRHGESALAFQSHAAAHLNVSADAGWQHADG